MSCAVAAAGAAARAAAEATEENRKNRRGRSRSKREMEEERKEQSKRRSKSRVMQLAALQPVKQTKEKLGLIQRSGAYDFVNDFEISPGCRTTKRSFLAKCQKTYAVVPP